MAIFVVYVFMVSPRRVARNLQWGVYFRVLEAKPQQPGGLETTLPTAKGKGKQFFAIITEF